MGDYGMSRQEKKLFSDAFSDIHVQEVDATIGLAEYQQLMDELEEALKQAEVALPDIEKYLEMQAKAVEIADKLGWIPED